ncbi:MAG TPA: signal recognition particle-docking protein FtsY [Gemmatimonadaceae bacterium]|jgi:fused signal recognition particle receptor|nr:signal recognition particle-docking protein FtsY [Gemmatimonadaceae bacterium]
MRILRRADDVPRRSLWQKIKDVALMDVGVIARGGVSPGSLERLEELLLEGDFGVASTIRLVADVEGLAAKGKVKTQDEFLEALRSGIESALRAGNSAPELKLAEQSPTVILVVGVNGAGKTTTIGKLAARLRSEGKSVLIAAGDTYRAGAIDQLRLWADRTGAGFVGSAPGADPAAIAFNAIDAAVARRSDVVIVDTAGRLHTQGGLMSELQKVGKVIAKKLPGAPHETLLVLDGTVGQNAVQQARSFAESVPITGIVITKLDGTARGGIVVAVHEAIDVPVKFVGVGEKSEDLVPFDAAQYAEDLLSE